MVEAPLAPTPRALVIDDEDAIRTALRRFFTRRGWEFDEAADGLTGLELIRASESNLDQAAHYSLIITDVQMPGISGIELCNAISSEFPRLVSRLVLSSGDIGAQDIQETAARANCKVLPKPFELKGLQQLMTELATPPE